MKSRNHPDSAIPTKKVITPFRREMRGHSSFATLMRALLLQFIIIPFCLPAEESSSIPATPLFVMGFKSFPGSLVSEKEQPAIFERLRSQLQSALSTPVEVKVFETIDEVNAALANKQII